MKETRIDLTDEQNDALKKLAERENMTVSQLLQQVVNNLLQTSSDVGREDARQRALRIIGRFHGGPSDLARRHDDYLGGAFGS